MDRNIQKKEWSWKKKLQWIVLPVVGMTLIYRFNQYSQKNQTEISRERIRIATVNAGTFQVSLDTLYLDSPEGGQVLEILVEEGATVQNGEPILRLKNKEMELLVRNQEETINSEINQLEEMQLNQQQSRFEQQQLAKMEFDIEGLRRSYERKAALWKDGLLPELDYLNSTAEYEYSQKRKRLMLELHEQEKGLQSTQIERQAAIVERRKQDSVIIRSQLATLALKAPVSGQFTPIQLKVCVAHEYASSFFLRTTYSVFSSQYLIRKFFA